MATAAVSEGLQERIESARRLHWELTRCQKELEEVRSAILARGKPEDIRRKFRACQSAMMMCGRLLLLDGRFKPRLPSDVRAQALDLLRAGAKPIELQRKLGLDNFTVRRLRHRELGDTRDLRKLRRLTAEQVAEIRSAGKGTVRRVFAEKFGVSMSLVSRVRNRRGVYRVVAKVSPVQQTTVARRPGPPSPETTSELRLRLNAELAQSLARMAELAKCKLAPYVIALVESAIADFRSRNIDSSFLLNLNDKKSAPAIAEERKGRSKFSPEERERIIEEHDGGMTIQQLSIRWGAGSTTIRRVLDCE